MPTGHSLRITRANFVTGVNNSRQFAKPQLVSKFIVNTAAVAQLLAAAEPSVRLRVNWRDRGNTPW